MQLFTAKLILQVEIKYIETVPCGPSFDSYYITKWRDATLKDLQTLTKFKELKMINYGVNNPIAYTDECPSSPTKLHKWEEIEKRKCLYIYKCLYCGSIHKIDSSD